MHTKLPGFATVQTLEVQKAALADFAPETAADNFLLHMAPVSIGVFFFGNFHPNTEDKVQAHRALYKTSFLYRHYLQPGGLKVVIDENSLTLTGRTASSAVSLMAYTLGTQIMGSDITIADETTRIEEHGRALKANEKNTDAELRARLQLMLATDGKLASEEIEVSVAAGQVKITGQVFTAANKTWAETLLHGIAPQAKLTLTVNAKAVRTTKGTIPSIDDDSLQALALTRLKLIASLGTSDIRATSQRQSLILSGTVRSAADKELAEAIVCHTYGLRDFKGSLTVKAAA